MRSPLLIARFVSFSVLVYLNLLALGFAGWEISSMRDAGLSVSGSPIFIIFNACALLYFIILASAELVVPGAGTGQVNFECGWTGLMSALQLASAVDVVVNGPPVYCRVQAYEAVCASSTVLAAITWTSSILIMVYFLTLFSLALSHASVYGAFWQTTVYQAPWFVEPALGGSVNKPSKPKEPWENPAFSAYEEEDEKEEEDLGDVSLTPPVVAWARKFDLEGLYMPSAPLRAKSVESMRPAWAKRVNTRRGIDPPFAPAPVAQRVSRLVKSYWSGTSAPPTPPAKASPSLPRPSNLNGGFIDCHRASYGYFPDEVADEDQPIAQPKRCEWVQAHR
ncbi:uncharacterized protein PHACADRAFT_256146 [Phanerochaete carnosa HHB-10118-sp]|uniref:Uncharacterized protein n=1 Tax=Phanerochaete carnosa (strain HHB-10118-sp) TaxID=650164 RepID=K5UZ98_PHACS|nr:uncharacterized protein PHACADRAFT_256146 [Phanerochaete carnosa HHB-10118-sp]EKM55491.1 hypothetical protein PHACADRAFT_256146 [Phanerochaete carnosa HHB-10118-sp]